MNERIASILEQVYELTALERAELIDALTDVAGAEVLDPAYLKRNRRPARRLRPWRGGRSGRLRNYNARPCYEMNLLDGTLPGASHALAADPRTAAEFVRKHWHSIDKAPGSVAGIEHILPPKDAPKPSRKIGAKIDRIRGFAIAGSSKLDFVITHTIDRHE